MKHVIVFVVISTTLPPAIIERTVYLQIDPAQREEPLPEEEEEYA